MTRPRALIVDDTPLNVKLLALLMTKHGYEVQTTGTAEAALALLAEAQPAVLLLDLRLPGMDGLALARRLRTDPAYAALVIVAVTASAMKGDESIALAAGCDAYVTKPVDTRAFPAQIAAAIARRRES